MLKLRNDGVPKKKKQKASRHALIRSALRGIWLFSDERKEALKRAKAGGLGWRCQDCARLFDKKEIEVDHIVPCGPSPGSKHAGPDVTWDGWMARLFVETRGLRVLCRVCHAKRTTAQVVQAQMEREHAGARPLFG